MFNPTMAQRVNERYRRLLLNQFPNWELESGALLTLNYDFVAQPNLEPITNPNTGVPAGPTLGITRTTTKMFSDWDSVLRTVLAGEASFTGCRRVENLALQSNDFENAEWTEPLASITKVTGKTDPEGGSNATELTADDTNGALFQSDLVPAGQTATNSIWMRRVSGTGDIEMYVGNSSTRTVIAITSSWDRYNVSTAQTATGNFGINITTSGDAIEVYQYQSENVSGQADPAPSEYQATTTVPVARNYTTKRRTNLILQSEAMDVSPWSQTRITIAANATTDPLGGNTADKLRETAVTNTFNVTQATQLLFAGETYSWSVYAKAAERDVFQVAFGSSDTVSNAYVNYDLTNGVLGTVDSGATNAAIEDVGNGWFRCSGTMVVDAGGEGSNSTGFVLVICQTGDTTAARFGGSRLGTVTEGLYVWGAQLEKASVRTAYIPTTTTVASSAFDTDLTSILGLLPAEARTNICLQSEDFTTTWLELNDTLAVVGNEAVAPDGTATADLLIDDGGGGTGTVRIAQNITTFSTSTAYTFSFYAKANGNTWTRFALGSMGSLVISAYFDLSGAGAVGATTGANNTSEFIKSVGNGWYRCGVIFTSDSSDTTADLLIYVADSDNDSTVNLDDSSSIFVWGAQLEKGAFATSYIPTTTASVTRNDDDILTTDVSWFNENAGTIYVAATPSVFGTNRYTFSISDGGTTSTLFQQIRSDAAAGAFHGTATGDDGFVTVANTYVIGTLSRAAFAYQLNDLQLYAAGVASAHDTSVLVPPSVTYDQMNVGQSGSGTLIINGHIASIRYYNDRGTDEEIEALSNGQLTPVT